ncbi:MAG: sugar O-acetyltransferase [Eubacterium sp.]|nr:sugar O-acetyltransferase [Eubacterium sp.]
MSSERIKMERGEWYDANFDRELLRLRSVADGLCFDYNHTRPGSPDQEKFLCQLLHVEELPQGLTLLAPVYMDYGSNVHFGKEVFVNHGCYFMDGAEIAIGDHAFIGPYCGFYTATHPLDYPRRNRGLEKAKPISIGDNCWLGANVVVLQGVRIGSGCVIAAGSVVKDDIPDHTVAAGNPARVIRTIKG